MNITIIGGGKLGTVIAQNLIKYGQKTVTIVEKNNAKCLNLAEELEANVINGDASEPFFLSSAGIEDTDVFVITTGSDEINFVCAEIINKLFNYKKLIVRVNNPKNEEIFLRIGVNSIISVTEIMGNYIFTNIKNFIIESEENDGNKKG